MYEKYKSPFGYQVGDNGIDSYGVDHSGFTLRDEIEYQTARDNRESQMMQMYNQQGITDNYPQYTTNFWGNADNNYGFGSSNITDAISAHPAMNTAPVPITQTPQAQTPTNNVQQLTMPAGSQYQITMPRPQEPTSWDKFTNWVEHTGDAMQAGAVGYATGATLGNFDEAMGAATAAVTLNPDNYTMGRDATRQLQNDLQQRHPYIYGGGEFLGAMNTPMHLVKDETLAQKGFNALTDTLMASVGYAQNGDDFLTNLAVNGFTNSVGLGADLTPLGRGLGTTGKKIIKQGFNFLTDKARNMFYNNEEGKY